MGLDRYCVMALSIHVVFRTHTVPTIGVDDSIPSNLPHPQVESHNGVIQVPVESSACFNQHILNDVTDVNSLLDLPVAASRRDDAQGLDAPHSLLTARASPLRAALSSDCV